MVDDVLERAWRAARTEENIQRLAQTGMMLLDACTLATGMTTDLEHLYLARAHWVQLRCEFIQRSRPGYSFTEVPAYMPPEQPTRTAVWCGEPPGHSPGHPMGETGWCFGYPVPE